MLFPSCAHSLLQHNPFLHYPALQECQSFGHLLSETIGKALPGKLTYKTVLAGHGAQGQLPLKSFRPEQTRLLMGVGFIPVN